VDLAVIDMPCYSKSRAIAVPDPHFHPDDAGDIIQRFSKVFPPNCMSGSEMLLSELGKTLGISKHALASCLLGMDTSARIAGMKTWKKITILDLIRRCMSFPQPAGRPESGMR
jgi:hypothetical protein